MNWLKKLFGFKEQSPKETKKEPKKTISSGATIGGYSSAYRGFDFPSSNDNDHYNPLSPTSPFFYGQNHEESAPVQNQEQEQHHTRRHHSDTVDNSHWHHHHHTGDSHSHDYPSSPSDSISYDSGCSDNNNSSGSDY
jgi:hypothetical protein